MEKFRLVFRLSGAASILACLLLVVACDRVGYGPGIATGPPTGMPSHPASPPPASPPPASGAAGGRGGCLSSELSVALANEDHALSHTYAQLVFTNTSRRQCVIGGYPGVSQVAAAGGQVGAAADRQGPRGGALTLAPGQQAHANLVIISAGVQEDCVEANQMTSAVGLRIYPPANRAAISLRYENPRPACTSPTVHQLSVTALVR